MRLEARGIKKSFGVTKALDGVDLDVKPGSICAVLGENGAGKSTLMKILSGALTTDSGSLALDGVPYAPADPLAARRRGVGIVYQELSVCPHLTVAENVLLGMESARWGWISRGATRERVERAFAPLARPERMPRPEQLLLELSTADRQLVEIARALAQERIRLLILDEPTSSLAADDVDRLFEALLELKTRGISIVYISHFLEEVRRIADEYVVLRDGRSISAGQVSAASNDALVRDMAGRDVKAASRTRRPAGEAVVRLENVAGLRLPERASLELHRGEVVGIAGLIGSGRSELLRCIFGLDAVRRGSVHVGDTSGPFDPARRLRQGVGLLSEDRKREGLALSLSIADNLTLSKLRPLRRHGLLSTRAQAAAAKRWVDALGVRCRDTDQPVSELSGGNQQKVALGRLLYHDVDVLLLDEPTRGIDVRSRNDIHTLIDRLAAQGKAILVISSQLPELFTLCDRIAVMHRGVLGAAKPSSELSEHGLLTEAAGA
jgi:ribose transport system ATP-binding protein